MIKRPAKQSQQRRVKNYFLFKKVQKLHEQIRRDLLNKINLN